MRHHPALTMSSNGQHRLEGIVPCAAPIGQGGIGQVWEAEQVSLKRRVALKLVRPDRVNDHTLDLFAREARAGWASLLPWV